MEGVSKRFTCWLWLAEALKKSGEHVEIKVIALHQISNGKIILTDELTHVINGNSEDKELGSKH